MLAVDVGEPGVECGSADPEQRVLPEHTFDVRADLGHRQRAQQTGGVPERIDDAHDPRLADYRQLKDAAARRKIEGDELFVAEGPVAIERMIASGHHVRSVLLDELKYTRMADLLAGAGAPVYVVDRRLLHDITG